MKLILYRNEIDVLFQQSPKTAEEGGFQQLLVTLQNQVDRNTGEINLTEDQCKKIPRYAFDYGNGGWEDMLKAIFSRTLGPNLGR